MANFKYRRDQTLTKKKEGHPSAAASLKALELRTFLRMITYNKRFIPECSDIMVPLSALVGKNTKFEWASICNYNFRKLKKKIMSDPILKYPMRNGDYHIENNASDAAIRGVLRILAKCGHLLVACKSQKLTDGKCW